MSKFTKELVNEYADKLLIGLSEEENKLVLEEFDIIEKSMDNIANFKGISEVEPMHYALDDFSYDLKNDIPNSNYLPEELLSNCSEVEDYLVSVVKVVG